MFLSFMFLTSIFLSPWAYYIQTSPKNLGLKWVLFVDPIEIVASGCNLSGISSNMTFWISWSLVHRYLQTDLFDFYELFGRWKIPHPSSIYFIWFLNGSKPVTQFLNNSVPLLLQAQSAINALNCSGVVLGSLPIRYDCKIASSFFSRIDGGIHFLLQVKMLLDNSYIYVYIHF